MASNDVIKAQRYAEEAKIAAATAKLYSQGNSDYSAAAAAYADNALTYSNDSESYSYLSAQYYSYATNLSSWFIGTLAAAPVLRNDGSALEIGDMYKNSTDDEVYSYNSDGTWTNLSFDAAVAKEYYEYNIGNYEYIAELTAQNYSFGNVLSGDSGAASVGTSNGLSVQDNLTNAVKGGSSFTTGAILNSVLDQINDGSNLYYWTGSFPKTVNAGASPDDDGYGLGYWAVAGDAVFRSEVGAEHGFQYVGQVASYAALKLVVPSYAGQRILLESHADHSSIEGWATLAMAPKGNGQFIAINVAGVEDGGTVAAVNDDWHWRRIIDGPYQPEWFGACSGTGDDDMIAIGKAVTAAAAAGVDKVRGEGIYTVKSSYTIPAVRQSSPVADGNVRQGLELYLNVIIVDAPSWPSVPTNWWDATAVFYPAVGVEHLRLTVNEFDGGGKATFFHSKDGGMATSHLHIGNMRNHIIGVRNLYDMAVQTGMVNVTGYLWQDGYIGILNGGTGNGGGNSECWGVDVTWLAAHRYGGVSLQDRSQYAHIKAGTIDYNGRWSAMLTLSNVVQATSWSVQFGDTLTANGVSGTALSNVMNCYGEQVLHITESADKLNGVSDYAVGATIGNADGTFTATISAITLTSDIDVRYFDVIASNVSGGFSRVNVTCTYGGGMYGANMFTNQIWTPSSVSGVGTSSYMGLEIGGSSANQFWYIRDLYGISPLFSFDKDQMQIGTNVTIGNNLLSGSTAQYSATIGTQFTAVIFSPAESEINSHYYTVNIGSSIDGQWAQAVIRVGTSAISICNVIQEEGEVYIILEASGLALLCTVAGSDALITFSTRRDI